MIADPMWQALHVRLKAAGLKPALLNDDGICCIEIHTPHMHIDIQRRPAYCDRGRWLVYARSTAPATLCIDFADGFPRYYFGDQALASELVAWLKARREEVIEPPPF